MGLQVRVDLDDETKAQLNAFLSREIERRVLANYSGVLLDDMIREIIAEIKIIPLNTDGGMSIKLVIPRAFDA